MSAKFTRSKSAIVKDLADKKMDDIQRSSKAIKNLGTQFIQKSYEIDFAKSPIDSGLAQELSGLDEVKINGYLITLVLKIATDYAVFFRRGFGSNKKYGERDPLEKSRERIIKGYLNMIK